MSWADNRLQDEVQLYETHTIMPDGTERVQFAFGAPWVATALFLGDIAFDSPQEAIDWWERRYG